MAAPVRTMQAANATAASASAQFELSRNCLIAIYSSTIPFSR